MAIVISGNGIDMGNNPVSNASQIDSTVINENGDNVATTSNLVGFKNYIINGNFDIWQRGTSFTGLTNGSYSADRWVVYDSVGDINYNVVRNAGIFTGGYGATYTWNSGTGTRAIIQFIENVTRFKVGSSVTVSFEAYTNSTPYSINVGIQGARGGWASSTSVVSSPISLTNTKTKYSVTLSVPNWSSLGIDWAHLEDTKLALRLDFDAGTNGKDFIIGNVQLEEGSVATPFENRPYGLELSLCQRYYEVLIVNEQPQADVFYLSWRYLPVVSFVLKRVMPTISILSIRVYPNNNTETANYTFNVTNTSVGLVDMSARGTLYAYNLAINAEL